MKVYVVGYEANDSGAISFWDWYPKQESAEKRKVELKGNKHCSTGIIYDGVIDLKGTDVDLNDKEDVNGFVENFLCENDWEKSFTKK